MNIRLILIAIVIILFIILGWIALSNYCKRIDSQNELKRLKSEFFENKEYDTADDYFRDISDEYEGY